MLITHVSASSAASTHAPASNSVAQSLRGAASVRLGLAGLMLLLCAWLPSDHYPPWFAFPAEALALAGLVLLFVAVLYSAEDLIAVPRIAIGVALFALLPWLQWIGGVNDFVGDALLSSLYLFGLAGAVTVGFHIGKPLTPTPYSATSFMHLLWLAALLSASIALLQWLGLTSLVGGMTSWLVHVEAGERVVANLAQPNQLATLLLMGMGAFVHIYRTRVIGGVGFTTGIAFMSLALVLSQSRTGLLGGVSLAAFLAWKSWQHPRGLSLRALAVWAMLFVLCFFALPVVSDFLYLGKGRGMPLTENSARCVLWQQVWLGILQSPWFGYGWNQTTTAHMAGAALLPGTLTITHAHNLFLDLMAWVGIPLGAAMIIAGLYWTFSRARRCRTDVAVHAMACLLPVLIHSLLEYPFAYSYFLVFAGLMIGLVEASTGKGTGEQVRTGWLWGAAVIFSFVGVVIAHEYLLVEDDFRQVRFEAANIGVHFEGLTPPPVRVNSQLREMLQAARVKPRPGMGKEELLLLRRVARRFPYSALTFRYVLASALNSDAAEASRQMALIRNLYGDHEYLVLKTRLVQMASIHPQLLRVQVP
jgi:O-antigen ligase